MKTWSYSAPSNIALIKYMGKTDSTVNIPQNASISYTLENLRTYVEISLSSKEEDHWEALQNDDVPQKVNLSPKGIERYLDFLGWLKQEFNCKQNFLVRSGNNFPANCGLASSASSFAALTGAAVKTICDLTDIKQPSVSDLATLSRHGSGSSCRSFFSPWGQWQGEDVFPVELPYKDLRHNVVVVAGGDKEVSSSLAHRLVTTSALFENRPQRAEQRLTQLMQAFNNKDWKSAYLITWQEFWDMHALFETAETPFGYMTHDSLLILNAVREFWKQHDDGPLVTMDAGPNIHLLFRNEQEQLQKQLLTHLSTLGSFDVL